MTKIEALEEVSKRLTHHKHYICYHLDDLKGEDKLSGQDYRVLKGMVLNGLKPHETYEGWLDTRHPEVNPIQARVSGRRAWIDHMIEVLKCETN